MRNTFNLYVWKYILPLLKNDLFSHRIFSIFSLAYITLFSFPRKLLFHYFFGKGRDYSLDTQKIIFDNPIAYQKLKNIIQFSPAQFRDGHVHISQVDILDPFYRYSVGSFGITYNCVDEKIYLSVDAQYRFGKNNNRLTGQLHNWLFAVKEKGYANDFLMFGEEISMDLDLFLSKDIKFNENFIKRGGPALGKLLL